jgi:hypothetical protein
MSKRFLKKIGLMALPILVSLVTSESSSAMRRARMNDCLEDQRLDEKRRKYLNKIPGIEPGDVRESNSSSIEIDLYDRFGEDTGQKVQWYVCREHPTEHLIKKVITKMDYNLHRMVNVSPISDPTVTCTDCDDDRRKEASQKGTYKKDKNGKWII